MTNEKQREWTCLQGWQIAEQVQMFANCISDTEFIAYAAFEKQSARVKELEAELKKAVDQWDYFVEETMKGREKLSSAQSMMEVMIKTMATINATLAMVKTDALDDKFKGMIENALAQYEQYLKQQKGENMKKVSKKNAEIICFKVDTEGFDYCFTAYSAWKEETDGTNLEPLILAYRQAQEKLNDAVNELREEYEIEES